MTVNQRIMVTAIIKTGNSYLLLQRSKHNKLWVGSWQFPEGGVEFGESPLKALRRELKEETKLNLENANLVSCHSSTLKYFSHRLYHVIRLFYFCKVSGKLRLSKAHSAAGWFAKGQIAKLKLIEGVKFKDVKELL